MAPWGETGALWLMLAKIALGAGVAVCVAWAGVAVGRDIAARLVKPQNGWQLFVREGCAWRKVPRHRAFL